MTTPPAWWVDALVKVAYGIRQQVTANDANAQTWDAPGIKATIVKLSETCGPADLARVVCIGSANTRLKTPGGITEPGPQWEGTGQAKQKQRPRCPTHKVLLQAGDCPKCAEGLTSNRPANFQDIYQQAVQAARDEKRALEREAIQ